MTVQLHLSRRLQPPPPQPAGELVDGSQGTDKPAKEAAQEHGQGDDDQCPEQVAVQPAGGQQRGQSRQGIQLQYPVDGPTPQLPPGRPHRGRDTEPQKDEQEKNLTEPPDCYYAHGMAIIWEKEIVAK